MKKTISCIIIILFFFVFNKYSLALEEVSFPDVTYVITDSGDWIEKNEYLKKDKEKQDIQKKSEMVFMQYIDMKSKLDSDINFLEGYATYYASKFQGRKTASGEKYNRSLMTAAMNGVSFGTNIKVTNLLNNKSIIVKVNDRIGSKKNIVDLSSGAFKKIATLSTGRVKVKVEILK